MRRDFSLGDIRVFDDRIYNLNNIVIRYSYEILDKMPTGDFWVPRSFHHLKGLKPERLKDLVFDFKKYLSNDTLPLEKPSGIYLVSRYFEKLDETAKGIISSFNFKESILDKFSFFRMPDDKRQKLDMVISLQEFLYTHKRNVLNGSISNLLRREKEQVDKDILLQASYLAIKNGATNLAKTVLELSNNLSKEDRISLYRSMFDMIDRKDTKSINPAYKLIYGNKNYVVATNIIEEQVKALNQIKLDLQHKIVKDDPDIIATFKDNLPSFIKDAIETGEVGKNNNRKVVNYPKV